MFLRHERRAIMDRLFVLELLRDRIRLLHKRYRASIQWHTEDGIELTYSNAQRIRTSSLTDMKRCQLVEELIGRLDTERLQLSDVSQEALLQMVEPCERHGNGRRGSKKRMWQQLEEQKTDVERLRPSDTD
ncbi:MAG: hypothetical protein Pg6A_19550 [Termitinemataceae bacterium]|nr:MAG: hypothetical protein Pg6A_19550 [Termitinemataceae bacterium]